MALLGGGEEVEEGGDAAEGVERVAGRLAWSNQQAVLRPKHHPQSYFANFSSHLKGLLVSVLG